MCVFQSTLPARGATQSHPIRYCPIRNFNPRSPHGERQRKAKLERTATLFQSTLPARGATGVTTTQKMLESISIHAPRTGSDEGVYDAKSAATFQSTLPARGATMPVLYSSPPLLISIHAPRTGSDEITSCPYPVCANYFNPRSPHGERPSRSGCYCFCWIFQSTLPARGATILPGCIFKHCFQFQSTLPARGATISFCCARL